MWVSKLFVSEKPEPKGAWANHFATKTKAPGTGCLGSEKEKFKQGPEDIAKEENFAMGVLDGGKTLIRPDPRIK